MNRRVVWLEAQRLVRERGWFVAFMAVSWFGGSWLTPNMFPGGWLLLMVLYTIPLITWSRSDDRAVDDAFLLVRGAVTRRGLTVMRWLLDACLVGLLVSGVVAAAVWGGAESAINVQAIASGAAFYAVAAVVVPSSRRSPTAAPFQLIGVFSVIALGAAGAALAAEHLLAIDRRDSLLALSLLTFAAFLSRSLLFPPDFDEPASSERRDVSATHADSQARSARAWGPFAAVFFAGMRMLFWVRAKSFWYLTNSAVFIGIYVKLMSFGEGASVAHSMFGFLFLASTAARAPTWLWFGDTAADTVKTRRSALELLLSLPIARRRLYAAQSLALSVYLGAAVVAGLTLGAAMCWASGSPLARFSFGVTAVCFAWSLLMAALQGRVALGMAAGAGPRELRKFNPTSYFVAVGLVALAPFLVLLFGSGNPSVFEGARVAIDHAWLITLVLAGLAVGVHVAACRRFEQVELD